MDEILFRNKYRIPSIRLPKWNYSGFGWYFVTICANGKQPFFGKIENGAMQLSEMGQVAQQCWAQIPDHFPDVQLDEFIIMPDHVHGIIVINRQIDQPVGIPQFALGRDVAMQRLYGVTSITRQQRMSAISPKPGSLPTIVRSFKSVCSYIIHKTFPNAPFMWQPRYYDRIIRNDDELNAIREYIRDNPLKNNPGPM